MTSRTLHNKHNCFESPSDAVSLNSGKSTTFGTMSSLSPGPVSIYRDEGEMLSPLPKKPSNPSSNLEVEENLRLQSKGSSSELDCGYDSETSSEVEKPLLKEKRKVGRPRCALKNGRSRYKVGRVWEFIRDLVMDSKYNPKVIRWVDRQQGIFRFENSDQVAKLWGLKRGNGLMNFEKFSRSVRHNYKKEYLLPVKNQRLVYKFGPKSYGWK